MKAEDTQETGVNEPGKFLNPASLLIISGAAVLAAALSVLISLNIPYSFTSAEKAAVYVTYGSGFKKIAEEIGGKGLLRNKLIFEAYVIATGAHKKLKAGEYEFSQRDSMAGLAAKMVRGDVLKHRIVVPEGSDIYDIAGILSSGKVADAQIFLALVKDAVFLKSIGIDRASAEGLLFPDTYYFVIGEGEKKIIAAMHAMFIEKSAIDMKKTYSAGGQLMSGYRLLKLASIIEKESKLDEERPKIASVFYNRLNSAEAYQRRLESCATVRYALNKKTGPISYKDTRVNSPYNTYIIIGLPPTPICNPGIKSMEAALNPAGTDYRYFVVKESGGHAFSETLEEHDKAKTDYKKKKRAGEL